MMEKINETVLLAIDFGNENLRVSVNHGKQVYVLKNVDNTYRFPQIIITNDRYSSIGTEAEKNLTAYSNCYFKDFKCNILKEPNNENYKACVIEVLKHYKQMSEEYVRKCFDYDETIDIIYLTIPIIDDSKENIWKSILQYCCAEAGFKRIVQRAEELVGTIYFMQNYFEKEKWSSQAYCVFNLGSIYSYSSLWQLEKGEYFYKIIDKTNGCSDFYIYLQRFFNRKIREFFEKRIFSYFIKSDEYDSSFFNEKFFDENKKYLSECYKKYRQVLETFSGCTKSMQLQFRHLIEDQEIEIGISRKEIENEIEMVKANILTLINKTKEFLILNQINKPIFLITIGNGIKFPDVQNLFKNEFKDDFHLRGVLCDEELVKGAYE